jgi:hypothetical protein
MHQRSRQQFDERKTEKKQANVMLSKDVIVKLDVLAYAVRSQTGTVIETRLRMEAESGVYLADS